MKWEVGQTVDVQSRTWAGINKPGGCAKITRVHYASDGLNVESVDVKYVLGGGYEKEIDPAIVSPFETLDRGGRKRRGRDFLMERADNVVKKVKQAMQKNKPNRTNDIGGKETQLSTTAKKTKEPDQSTSPSTPITPEHPSVSKSTTFKKGTISVPSFVIADRAVEVSPLQVDRAVAEAKKSTVARRGLFGCGTSSNNRETNTQSKVQKTIKAAKASIAPNGSDSAARDCAFHQSSQSVTKAHSAAVKNSLMMKQGRGMSAKLGGKKTTMANRKPAATAGGAARKTTKASLKGVFDYERRKAREFLDEVCRAPCHDMEVDDPASKENRLNTSASESEEERKPSAASNRREEFLDLFSTLRRKFDDEDGTMEEAAFRTQVDKRATKPFTIKELDDNLEHLYQEGKLMKSDGILYIID